MVNATLIKQKLERLKDQTETDLQVLQSSAWRKDVPRADFEYLLQQKRMVVLIIDDVIDELGK